MSYSIGRERSEHDGSEASVQRQNPFIRHNLLHDASRSVRVLPFRCCLIGQYITSFAPVSKSTLSYISIIGVPVCSLDLSVSGGIATSQLRIPAVPPARMVLPILMSFRLQQLTVVTQLRSLEMSNAENDCLLTIVLLGSKRFATLRMKRNT